MRKQDKKHLDRVASLNCIVCLNEGLGPTPAEIHHIRAGYGISQRAPDTETIPLCRIHHRGKENGEVGYHFSPTEFEVRYGTERELLEQVMEILKMSVSETSHE